MKRLSTPAAIVSASLILTVAAFEAGYWTGRGHARPASAAGVAGAPANPADMDADRKTRPPGLSHKEADAGGDDESAAGEGAGTRPKEPTATELAEKISAMAAGEMTPEKHEQLVDWIGDLAAMDATKALELANALPGVKLRHDALSSLIRNWAEHDAEAAWKFVIHSPNDGSLPEDRYELLFHGIAQQEPTSALDFLWKHRDEMTGQRDRAERALDEIYNRGGHSAMQSWVEALPAGKMRDTAMNRFIDQWARYNPEAARAWMDRQSIPAGNLPAAQVELAESWARVSPENAVKWVQGLPAQQQTRDVYDAVFRRWIQYDRNGAAQWLANQPPSPALDRSIERYTWSVMDLDPASTAPWAESITDKDRRFRALAEVADRWGRKDPQALARYVASRNFPADQQQRLLRSVSKR